MKSKYAIMIFGTLATLAADQISKLAIFSRFQHRQSMTIIENLFAITYVGNDGAAFGLFSGYNLFFFLGISAVAISFIIYFFISIEPDRKLLAAGLALILGGALGNITDRVRLGFVIDFLDVHHKFSIIDYNFVWPKFNVADMAILIGVALFLIDMIKIEKQKKAFLDAQTEE